MMLKDSCNCKLFTYILYKTKGIAIRNFISDEHNLEQQQASDYEKLELDDRDYDDTVSSDMYTEPKMTVVQLSKSGNR